MRTRFSSLLFVSMAACGGPGAVGNAARPEAPTGSEAFEEKPAAGCEGVGKYAEPLIVDWKSQERTDLELAMKKGVAVVSYDCKTIRMLKDCSLDGSYEYAGVSLKEDMVQLENADEVRANLPLSGIKLGGELERGSSIDVALVMVGKRGSTAGAVSKDTLKGTCEGATHVVRAAYVGAFAMARGSRGKVRAVAEVFGAGGEAKSESQKHTSNKDGDVTACKSSSPDSPKPPDQCQSALRLELTPISNQPVAAEKQEKTSPADLGANTCGPGEVRAHGKCTTDQDQAHRCNPKDEAECRAQCDKGDGYSCQALGYLQKKTSSPEARAAFDKSCDKGYGYGCMAAAESRLTANMQKNDPRLIAEAEKLLDKGCLAGEGWVCWNTASWYMRPETLKPPFGRNMDKGMQLLERGCALGYAPSCASLGTELVEGKNTKKDATRGIEVLKRACDGGAWESCERMGNYLRDGKHVAKDGLAAETAFGRACALGGLRACHSGAMLYMVGDGVPKDVKQGRALLERGCPDQGSAGWDACRSLGDAYAKGEGVSKDPQRAAGYYTRGLAFQLAGEIYEKGSGGKPDLAKALEQYKEGCRRTGSSELGKKACASAGRLLEKQDKAEAKAFYEDLCKRMGLSEKQYCAAFKKLGGDPAAALSAPKPSVFPKTK